jgi:hypothetical protein
MFEMVKWPWNVKLAWRVRLKKKPQCKKAQGSENQFCRIKKPKIRLQKDISISFWMLRAAKIDRLKKYASFILQIKIKYQDIAFL